MRSDRARSDPFRVTGTTSRSHTWANPISRRRRRRATHKAPQRTNGSTLGGIFAELESLHGRAEHALVNGRTIRAPGVPPAGRRRRSGPVRGHDDYRSEGGAKPSVVARIVEAECELDDPPNHGGRIRHDDARAGASCYGPSRSLAQHHRFSTAWTKRLGGAARLDRLGGAGGCPSGSSTDGGLDFVVPWPTEHSGASAGAVDDDARPAVDGVWPWTGALANEAGPAANGAWPAANGAWPAANSAGQRGLASSQQRWSTGPGQRPTALANAGQRGLASERQPWPTGPGQRPTALANAGQRGLASERQPWSTGPGQRPTALANGAWPVANGRSQRPVDRGRRRPAAGLVQTPDYGAPWSNGVVLDRCPSRRGPDRAGPAALVPIACQASLGSAGGFSVSSAGPCRERGQP
jgi:hypothetical protein